MGMCAQVLAVGPYSASIAEWLDYGPDIYKNTKEGAVITCMLFGISEGSTLSRHLAAFLGISEAWDFNQHLIRSESIDFVELRKFTDEYPWYVQDAEKLEALCKAGFTFHFRPEG